MIQNEHQHEKETSVFHEMYINENYFLNLNSFLTASYFYYYIRLQLPAYKLVYFHSSCFQGRNNKEGIDKPPTPRHPKL